MSLTRRLFNLIGALVAVGILAIGVLMAALPVFLQSLDTDNEQASVAQSNALLEARIVGLQSQSAQLSNLRKELADLEEQIPSTTRADSVSALTVSAAASTSVKLQSITVGEVGSFAAAGATATATAQSTASTASTSAAGTSTDAGQTSQFQVVITVTAKKATQIPAFVDALRNGSRVLRIDKVALGSDTSAKGYQGTITAFAFVRSA